MGNMVSRERWLVSEEWWSQIAPLRPKPKRRARWRGGRPRVPDRQALHGILFVLRTHSGFNRFCRILIRWEKKAKNYLGRLHFACAIIPDRQAEVLG